MLVYDLDRGTLTPLIFDPTGTASPVWTKDGAQIVFAGSRDGGPPALLRLSADGTGQVEQLTTSVGTLGQAPFSFSPDGKALTFGEFRSGPTAADTAILSMDDGTTEPLLEGPGNQYFAEISPDGRWVAYVSNESGRDQVYVSPYPNVGDGRWPISTNGGVLPLWGPDSRELFYRELEPPVKIRERLDV